MSVFSHASGRCIDVVDGKAVQGARLMISSCSPVAASQRWVFASDGSMRGLGMCVQLADGSTADGTDVELARCNGGAVQRFTLNSHHDLVSGFADKCADVRDNGTANGTRLQLWSCAGTDNQKWSTA
ncbi:RICIN domain-containing protein [Streptomyces sp. NBC_01455]|uniref:RICIN domain-containing protein n=1 Tax=Streptomyces sp. NBC_01455 TaxID=2903874 RepID=UPI002E308873|nr:RICIN domain-containing protein [Streptomyces sp. NBC_01455]